MKKRKVFIPLLAVSTILAASPVNLNIIQANTTQEDSILQGKETNSQGLLGYYFNDLDFKNPTVITTLETGDLSIDNSEIESTLSNEKQYFQSAIWTGFVNVEKDGEYTFSTSDNNHVTISVNDQEVMNRTSDLHKIWLEKGQLYEITVKYQRESPSEKGIGFQLYWTTPDNTTETIPKSKLLLPKLKAKSSKSRTERSANMNREIVDEDNDGIPDSLEIEGYTVDVKNKRSILTPWVPTVHEKKGLRKYQSSPQKWSTASDPYSDFEKVTGRIDKKVSLEARDPRIAAFPNVTVDMEKIIISKIEDKSKQQGGSQGNTISTGTSTSKTHTLEEHADVSFHASLFDFGGSVSAGISNSNSSTVTIDTSESTNIEKSWSETLGVNTADAAKLNANIRFKNTGTAPIYNALSTTSLVLGNNQTIATIKAKENQMAQLIAPNEYYPSKKLAAISLNAQDDFSSTPITMNYNQLMELEKTKKLRLDTDQVYGNIGEFNHSKGRVEVNTNLNWSNFLPQIEETTARIILQEDNNDSTERRVAAVDPNDFLEMTKPDVTLKEALKLAYGFKEENRQLKYKEKDISRFEFVFDKETNQNIQQQLKGRKFKNIYEALDNIQLNAKMNILVRDANFRYVDGKRVGANDWFIKTTHQQVIKWSEESATLKIDKNTTEMMAGYLIEIVEPSGKKELVNSRYDSIDIFSILKDGTVFLDFKKHNDNTPLRINNGETVNIYAITKERKNLAIEEGRFPNINDSEKGVLVLSLKK
ncbi:TPA: binary toxin-like calcium binding domain-containing protein [Bacillus tropicus]|uniref:binary toxin-like calcium binding domain-containing protein n=1 Tax=Bacillus cereus group TaxID=86661 RepID=UPI00003CB5AD|nr:MULTISPECIES: binary toxin-like calcium binding domain-containing protein [Bacillus cereus group]AIY72933.1 protective antigen [Bacillus cereus]AJI08046.1 protective antigen [Bacillus cereus G9241]EAL15944.1 protective antigen [Bacillus cereus G9241]QPS53435.1 peptidase [Bacillus tropicus]